MRLSVELVPRSHESLLREVTLIRDHFPMVTMLNIPDLLRFPVRSWDAHALTSPSYPTIPHIRAMDIPRGGDIPMLRAIVDGGISEVLVVTGDAPHDTAHTTYTTTATEAIARLKRTLPKLRVYASVDPYRQSLRAEREYIKQKLDAGADGFFTQPFFDRRLMAIYADVLAAQTVFWGVTPVVTDGARSYWETTNNVVFPADFEATLAWNCSRARDIIAEADELGANVYVMPLRVNLLDYLRGVFS